MRDSKYVVITSINEPTHAVRAYAKWRGWEVVVVGDRKTPREWRCPGITFLDIEAQYSDRLYRSLANAIPENTYVRKMLGFVYAIRNGATAIFETDDDNVPYGDAESVLARVLSPGNNDRVERLRSDVGWLNIYRRFGAGRCWPRGFPIELVRHPDVEGRPGSDARTWKVAQFLVDQDPDVDAIYRMVAEESVYFSRQHVFALDEGTFCPFNSQATLWLPEAFPCLFLPIGLSDRVADILRGYIALVCLWRINATLSFCSPIMFQERNRHILLDDFSQEVALYLNAAKWTTLLKRVTGRTASECYSSALGILAGEGVLGAHSQSLYLDFLSAAGLR